MRVTINDLAQKLNLSKAAVSLVLNGKGERMSHETRKLILKTADEMGYRPNKIARSLKRNSTKTIGLIIPDIRNFFFAEIVKGVEDEAYTRGYDVFFCNSDDSQEKEERHIRALLDWGVDGIVLDRAADKAHKNDESLEILRKSEIPVVLVDRGIADSKFSAHFCTVLLDNEKGAFEATLHLIKLGHKKIGCLVGSLWLDTDKQRLTGYKKAMAEAGLTVEDSLTLEAGYHFESGASSGIDLYQKGVSAIFAFNDLMAYGAISGLEEQGIKVPEDISVLGFDDIYYSRFMGNRLTSVAQPAYDMGKKALLALLDEMEPQKAEHKNYILEPSLHIRKTTAKPKNVF